MESSYVTEPLPDWKMKPAIDFSKSPHAKLRQVPVGAVTVTGYWGEPEKDQCREQHSKHEGRAGAARTNDELRASAGANPLSRRRGQCIRTRICTKWTEAVGFVADPAAGRSVAA